MSARRIALAFVSAFGLSAIGASCNKNNTEPPRTVAQVTPDPATGTDARSGTAIAIPNPPSNGQIESIDGLDLAGLRNTTMKETFWAVANDELSPCGDPHSLAACGRDNTCNLCLPALKFLARQIEDGFPSQQLGELVRTRYGKSSVVTVHTEGAPVRGAATASVTLVEFSDYECPHCGAAAPALRKLEEKFTGKLKVIHMHFPLAMHANALLASKAAIAAGKQGKFWEFHDLLFANQRALAQSNLDGYATQLGLDLNRFHTDMNSAETSAKIQADKHEGERLEIGGTPTMYINGRLYPLEIEDGPMSQWIEDELAMPR